jgi:hypothetical protein
MFSITSSPSAAGDKRHESPLIDDAHAERPRARELRSGIIARDEEVGASTDTLGDARTCPPRAFFRILARHRSKLAGEHHGLASEWSARRRRGFDGTHARRQTLISDPARVTAPEERCDVSRHGLADAGDRRELGFGR